MYMKQIEMLFLRIWSSSFSSFSEVDCKAFQFYVLDSCFHLVTFTAFLLLSANNLSRFLLLLLLCHS